MKLTELDKMVLMFGATGFPMNYEWAWTCCGRNVTRQVNKLKKAQLIDVMYFRNSASAQAKSQPRSK